MVENNSNKQISNLILDNNYTVENQHQVYNTES